ncbi:hypothetical protein CLAFUW4_20000 [Fulvia fulva]|uniref:uncharacterized protein n=1 Tax=Passalora fulva TaxID=5499 RepID=UPI0028526967|nr:uncharacterized protein CLAFUR5_20000 [Fulvia fulva]KAK4636299.1 hypothetical protein CLAFUR4_20000 [Fulvia fulva]KAK4637213.1 hypothetical protein CLAFUR0_20000 [Fulvia fulva]WMI38741.1 hypothetical protein CLAFUR5_20000 [Fulvia fulva]WPV08510.1 hypothetical protein CLAFUW4_20000 [Fulvia fulva]WPV25079.1 hypothetical protein CLAFUW7_20000 [Fulvia fulva]
MSRVPHLVLIVLVATRVWATHYEKAEGKPERCLKARAYIVFFDVQSAVHAAKVERQCVRREEPGMYHSSVEMSKDARTDSRSAVPWLKSSERRTAVDDSKSGGVRAGRF